MLKDLLELTYMHELIDDNNFILFGELQQALTKDGKNAYPDFDKFTDVVEIPRMHTVICIRHAQQSIINALIENYANAALHDLLTELSSLSTARRPMVIVSDGELSLGSYQYWETAFIGDKQVLKSLMDDYKHTISLFDIYMDLRAFLN